MKWLINAFKEAWEVEDYGGIAMAILMIYVFGFAIVKSIADGSLF